MKSLLIAFLFTASMFAQEPAKPTITDAQRIAYLKAENAALRKQLQTALADAAAAKGTDAESVALAKISSELASACPKVMRTQDGDVQCLSEPIPPAAATPAPVATTAEPTTSAKPAAH